MTQERWHKFGYNALRIFHWIMFFIVVEIIFCFAGWMFFGGIGMILDGVIASPEHQSNQHFFRFLSLVGKAVGLTAGVFTTWLALGRYTKPNHD